MYPEIWLENLKGGYMKSHVGVKLLKLLFD
jgi:hypothetical protein